MFSMSAATFTWDAGGGADESWGTGTNWVGNSTPSLWDYSDTAAFGSNGTLVEINNFFKIDGIVFNAGANSFNLTDNGGSYPYQVGSGGVINNSTNTQNFGSTLQTRDVGTVDAASGDINFNDGFQVWNGDVILQGANDISISGFMDIVGYKLTKDGTGTLTVNVGMGNFSGDIQVDGGTFLYSGGTNGIGDSHDLIMNGGTFEIGGNYTDTLSSLTVNSSSIIDMGTANAEYTFSSFSYTGGALSIYNWSGTQYQTGGSDQLLFTDVSNINSNFKNILFYSDAGTTFIGNGWAVGNELIAIPEPSTYITGVLLIVCAVGYRYRTHKRTKSVEFS